MVNFTSTHFVPTRTPALAAPVEPKPVTLYAFGMERVASAAWLPSDQATYTAAMLTGEHCRSLLDAMRLGLIRCGDAEVLEFGWLRLEADMLAATGCFLD